MSRQISIVFTGHAFCEVSTIVQALASSKNQTNEKAEGDSPLTETILCLSPELTATLSIVDTPGELLNKPIDVLVCCYSAVQPATVDHMRNVWGSFLTGNATQDVESDDASRHGAQRPIRILCGARTELLGRKSVQKALQDANLRPLTTTEVAKLAEEFMFNGIVEISLQPKPVALEDMSNLFRKLISYAPGEEISLFRLKDDSERKNDTTAFREFEVQRSLCIEGLKTVSGQKAVWTCLRSRTGRLVYHNRVTKRKTYHRPSDFDGVEPEKTIQERIQEENERLAEARQQLTQERLLSAKKAEREQIERIGKEVVHLQAAHIVSSYEFEGLRSDVEDLRRSLESQRTERAELEKQRTDLVNKESKLKEELRHTRTEQCTKEEELDVALASLREQWNAVGENELGEKGTCSGKENKVESPQGHSPRHSSTRTPRSTALEVRELEEAKQNALEQYRLVLEREVELCRRSKHLQETITDLRMEFARCQMRSAELDQECHQLADTVQRHREHVATVEAETMELRKKLLVAQSTMQHAEQMRQQCIKARETSVRDFEQLRDDLTIQVEQYKITQQRVAAATPRGAPSRMHTIDEDYKLVGPAKRQHVPRLDASCASSSRTTHLERLIDEYTARYSKSDIEDLLEEQGGGDGFPALLDEMQRTAHASLEGFMVDALVGVEHLLDVVADWILDRRQVIHQRPHLIASIESTIQTNYDTLVRLTNEKNALMAAAEKLQSSGTFSDSALESLYSESSVSECSKLYLQAAEIQREITERTRIANEKIEHLRNTVAKIDLRTAHIQAKPGTTMHNCNTESSLRPPSRPTQSLWKHVDHHFVLQHIPGPIQQKPRTDHQGSSPNFAAAHSIDVPRASLVHYRKSDPRHSHTPKKTIAREREKRALKIQLREHLKMYDFYLSSYTRQLIIQNDDQPEETATRAFERYNTLLKKTQKILQIPFHLPQE